MANLSWIEIIYWGSTIIGSTLFILRIIMMLVGGGFGHDDFEPDLSTDIDTDFNVDHEADPSQIHGDTDYSFKLLSMQGITAFFMMFGLVGLALLKANSALFLTVLGGAAAGLFTVWVISILFYQMRRLQSDGTVNIQNAVGETGSVYLTIPAEGSGQVQVTVQGGLRMFDAVSSENQKIVTGEKVRVTGVVNSNTLIVEKIR